MILSSNSPELGRLLPCLEHNILAVTKHIQMKTMPPNMIPAIEDIESCSIANPRFCPPFPPRCRRDSIAVVGGHATI